MITDLTPQLPAYIEKPETFLIALEHSFRYDMDTGEFFWIREAAKGKCKIGDKAGSRGSEGYNFLRFNDYQCQASNAAWFFVFGVWPKEIDHKNGRRNEDRIGNLRPCTRAQNNINGIIRSDNESGYPGVSFEKRRSGWQAYINKNGKRHYCGLHATKEAAIKARQKKERELYGEFAS